MFKVAIVGRPNVGKSSLFNLLINERKAITDSVSGTTIDRLYGTASWLNRTFSVIDTGGLENENSPFKLQIKAQVEVAIREADLIIFLTDVLNGVTQDDLYINKLLRLSRKEIVVVVNKVDNTNLSSDIYDFYTLGHENVLPLSTKHKIGFGQLLELVCKKISFTENSNQKKKVRFAVLGRPNVGKSSLVNALLRQNRQVVSNIPGTTKDAVDCEFKYFDKDYVVVDTAGILRRGAVGLDVEKYAQLRALNAITDADICLLLLDTSKPINELDKNIAGYIKDANKGIIIVCNKWDLVAKDSQTMTNYINNFKSDFKMFQYAPFCFISALNGSNLEQLMQLINQVYENINKEFKTSVLNQILAEAVTITPPKTFNNGIARFKYCTQKQTNPVRFLLFVNNPDYVHFSYVRYLENEFRTRLDLLGAPLVLEVVKGD